VQPQSNVPSPAQYWSPTLGQPSSRIPTSPVGASPTSQGSISPPHLSLSSPPPPNLPVFVKPPAAVPIPNYLEDETPDVPVNSNLQAAAPPRPPNPELVRLHLQLHSKFATEMNSLASSLAADADRLRATQADLLAGEPAIRDEMARLEAVRDVCRGVSSRLDDTVKSAEANVRELRRRGDPEVDELVCSTSIVHNQLINLVAEDNAIEDTVYHLHRALNAGRIDLERFLRTTRALAEEQFYKRALIEKITTAMPIGASMGWA